MPYEPKHVTKTWAPDRYRRPKCRVVEPPWPRDAAKVTPLGATRRVHSKATVQGITMSSRDAQLTGLSRA